MKFFIVLALGVAASANAASLDAILQPAFASGRIINGHAATKGEAPYIVSLNNNGHFCAGVIIDPHWVLTAAHCRLFSHFQVIAGLHERNDQSDVQIRSVSGAMYQIQHHDYIGGVGPYDIMLVAIQNEFNLTAMSRDGSASVEKIALPSGQNSPTGAGKLYGWGLDNSGTSPNTLQTLDVDVINYGTCKAALPSNAPIHTTNICSHKPGFIDGACNGDSGGPLVKVLPSGDKELIGLVSWGYSPCTLSTYPSVYTWIEPHLEWIRGYVGDHV